MGGVENGTENIKVKGKERDRIILIKEGSHQHKTLRE